MRDEELRRRFEGLREADAGGRVPGFGVMRARALEAGGGAVGRAGWWVLGGGVAAAAVVLLVGGAGRESGLESLPPLLGESVGEVEFLGGVAGGDEWLGRSGSDVLLPVDEIRVL